MVEGRKPHFPSETASKGRPRGSAQMSGSNAQFAAFQQAVTALCDAARLSLADAEQLRPLRDRHETFAAGALVQPPQRKDRLRLITSGWLYEARLLPDGRRQIFGYLLPGDLVTGRHGARTTRSALFALTRVDTTELTAALAAAPGAGRTSLSEGLARALEQQEHRGYGALVRLGQYTAQERMAHLIIELRDRLARVGQASRTSFRAPLTQEHLADTLGLSLIHVNRVLRQLRNENLLTIKFGMVTLLQPEKLELLAAGAAGR